MDLQSDRPLFEAKFDELLAEMTERDLNDPALVDAYKRLREILVYNVTGGKKNRGLSVISSLRELLPPSQLTQDAVQQAVIVGWCIEMVQGFYLMGDDIMDDSVTRRGQLCWYKKAGIYNEEERNNAKKILLEMGEFFQIQDDYLDCFGDPAVTGKIGTDIQDNKCSWLVVKALEVVTTKQRSELEACYGRKDEVSVAKVKELYNTLQMPTLYHTYEEESFQRLQNLIAQHALNLPCSVFLSFAKKIYKRKK